MPHRVSITPDSLGWDERWSSALAALEDPDLIPGRVARVDRRGAIILAPGGSRRARAGGLAVGDWVAVDPGGGARILPRRSELARRAAGSAVDRQIMVANVDLVVAVAGLDRPLRRRRLHRAVALAHEAGVLPVVVLTKADLARDPEAAVREAARAVPGVPVEALGADDGAGIAAVRALVAGAGTAVLLGESGAGKSTLVNRLAGRAVLATGAVRAGDAKGRHTTTARHLVPLPGGGVVIDTPGIRELGIAEAGEGVERAFADVAVLARECRFTDCRHAGEPGCAVAAAVAAGHLDPERAESHARLRREAEVVTASERERRVRGRRGARMAREAQAERRRRRGDADR